MFKFSKKSLEKLNKVNQKLKYLAEEVIKISSIDFGIVEGLRDLETQQKYFQEKKSKCDGVKNKSKHQDGLAIDIVCFNENGKATYEKEYYYYIAGLFEAKAKELNIEIQWGGWWKSIVDYPHFELK